MATVIGTTDGTTRTITLVVDGDLDVATAPRFVSSFEDALTGRPATILLDLSGVDFADSSGIAALIRCRRRAVRCNSQLVLDVGVGAVARLLDLTRLRPVFDLV